MLHALAKSAGVDGVLVLACYGENPLTGRKDKHIRRYGIGDVGGMVDEIMNLEGWEHLNVYIPWHIMRPGLTGSERGGLNDLRAILALPVDLDADMNRAGELPIAAPYSVESSPGNFQPVYAFSRALLPEEAQPIADALQAATGSDHGTKDLAHVWRVPGTLNWPNKKKAERGRPIAPQPVKVAKPWAGNLTEPEALRDALAKHYKPGDNAKANEAKADGGAGFWTFGWLTLSESLKKLITAPAAPSEDRSRIAASVICSLFRLGWTDDQIAAAIRAHPQGIGERYLNDENNLRGDIKRLRRKFEESDESAGADPSGDLRTSRAEDLEMRGITWLWPGRFALGKFGLIAGLPDYGKGQIAAFLAAAATAGIELPCGEGFMPQGNVIWFNAEDSARDTVVPRLVAAGADRKRVHFVDGARVNGQDKYFSLVTDLPLLRKAIKRIGNVVLVIIDPMSAYLGVGKVDGRSATDVRGVLTPLTDMAEEVRVAVIGIAHFNKKDDVKSALLRVSDSIAYVAAARHVYRVLDNPEDKNSKLFVKAKNNLAADKKALRYGIGVRKVDHDKDLRVDIDAPFVVWFPQHVDMTANEAMEAGNASTAKREAKEFLQDRLRAGPAKADALIEEARQDGISLSTLKRAKKELGITSRKDGLEGGWVWELSGPKGATGLKGAPE